MIPSFLSLLACRQRSQQPTSRAQKHHIHSTPPPTSLNRQAPQEPARQSMPSPLPLPPRLAPLSNHLPTHWYTYAYRFTLLHMKLPFASQTHDTSSCAYHSASCALPPSSCLQWSIYFLTIAAFSRAYYSHAYSYAIQLIDGAAVSDCNITTLMRHAFLTGATWTSSRAWILPAVSSQPRVGEPERGSCRPRVERHGHPHP